MGFSQEHRSGDLFEQLPDAILLEIFNKIIDAKSLVRCLSVSKRFNAQIPQIHSVFLRLPRQRVAAATKPAKLFKGLVRFIQNLIPAGKRQIDYNNKIRKALYYSPSEALKSFGELKSLHLELPCCNNNNNKNGERGKDSVLKWKANFGASLENCVILGANSVTKQQQQQQHEEENENGEKSGQSQGQTSNALTDEDLKSRIVWVISSLIAASARHYVTKRVFSSSPALRSVVVSDSERRGRVSATRWLGDELSTESSRTESSLQRSLIPDLVVKMWYVPRIVLSQSGRVVEGATLVVIRPLEAKGLDGQDEELGFGGFDGDEEDVLGEAVKEIVKLKKTYVMEMTSF